MLSEYVVEAPGVVDVEVTDWDKAVKVSAAPPEVPSVRSAAVIVFTSVSLTTVSVAVKTPVVAATT